MLLKSTTPSNKSDMDNSFSVIFMEINIAKTEIIKIFTRNNDLINRKCGITRIFIAKDYSIIRKYSIIKFLITLLVTNQSVTNFNVGRKESAALSHVCWVLQLSRQYFSMKRFSENSFINTFLVSYIYQGRIFGNSFITHFLDLILIMNRIKYKGTSNNSFNTHFLSLIAFRNELYCRWISITTVLLHILLVLQQQGKN